MPMSRLIIIIRDMEIFNRDIQFSRPYDFSEYDHYASLLVRMVAPGSMSARMKSYRRISHKNTFGEKVERQFGASNIRDEISKTKWSLDKMDSNQAGITLILQPQLIRTPQYAPDRLCASTSTPRSNRHILN